MASTASDYKRAPATASRFAGFPAAALTFFRGLDRNNNREWFQARKQVFEEQVKAPMTALVEAINAELARFAPSYLTDAREAIFRIYRDTRFSADKRPYKTQIAAAFRRRGMEKHAGGALYFSVSHKQIEVAGGVYMPGPEQLLSIRNRLAERHVEFRRLLADRRLRSLMGELAGDRLTRVPKGFPADHPAEELLRGKQWYFYVLLDARLASTPKILPDLLGRFRAVLPVVEFLNAPLGRS